MPPCHACLHLTGLPGHIPPHPALRSHPSEQAAGGQRTFFYGCRYCGHLLKLAFEAEEIPDVWAIADR